MLVHQRSMVFNFFDLRQSGVSLVFCSLSNELPIVLLILFSFTLWVCLLSPHSGTGAWDGLGPHPSPGLQVGGESPLGFGQGSRSWDCYLRTV